MLDDIFDVSIFLVTPDGDLINYAEYDKDVKDIKVEFVMVTNDLLNSDYDEDNTIFIHSNFNLIQFPYKWYYRPSGYVEVPGTINVEIRDLLNKDYNEQLRYMVSRHLNGYEQSLVWLKSNIVNCKPIKRLYEETKTYKYKSIHGYMPAIGQLILISKNYLYINKLFNDIGTGYYIRPYMCYCKKLGKGEQGMRGYMWSSTSCDQFNQWILSNGLLDKRFKLHEDIVTMEMFPLYKLDV